MKQKVVLGILACASILVGLSYPANAAVEVLKGVVCETQKAIEEVTDFVVAGIPVGESVVAANTAAGDRGCKVLRFTADMSSETIVRKYMIGAVAVRIVKVHVFVELIESGQAVTAQEVKADRYLAQFWQGPPGQES